MQPNRSLGAAAEEEVRELSLTIPAHGRTLQMLAVTWGGTS